MVPMVPNVVVKMYDTDQAVGRLDPSTSGHLNMETSLTSRAALSRAPTFLSEQN